MSDIKISDYPQQAEPACDGLTRHAARVAGAAAFKAGDPISSCPHDVDSRDRVDWRAGWLDENKKAEDDQ